MLEIFCGVYWENFGMAEDSATSPATNLGGHGDMHLNRGLEKNMRVMYKNMAEMAKVFIEGFRTIPATIESCLDKREKVKPKAKGWAKFSQDTY